MTIYDIINPSDPVTIEGDDDLVAAVSILLVGTGSYGLRRDDGKIVLPILLGTAQEWLHEHVPNGIQSFINEHFERMADVLDSAIVCEPEERGSIVSLLLEKDGDFAKSVAEWNDVKRSSLNDICRSCSMWAKNLRGLRNA